ncbi:MAG: glycosyltransferase [Rickettsiales bacterium]|jgi:glycosyltransferase involved in cell wall biosynthesis|nr:glycosyltransferase [Rickettsiales bacterium]
MPRISIIIPNYNNAKYLAGCINSVQAQTFTDTEIIVIDDCSHDNSVQIITDLAAADPRIVFHKMPKNSGVGSARNAGIDAARGEFIFFLDSDDALHPTTLEGMMTIQSATNADMVVGNYTKVPESFHIPENANFIAPVFDFEAFAENHEFAEKIENLNLVVVWGKLIRRETLGDIRFDPAIYPYEDVEFMLRLYGAIKVGAITPNMAVYYRLSLTSVIADKTRDVSKDVIAVLNSIADNVPNYSDDYAKFVKRYAYMFLRLWIESIFRKMKKDKARAYQKGLRHQMHKVAKCVRRIRRAGVFRDMNISLRHRIALFMFGLGFVKSAGRALAFEKHRI